MLTFKHSPRVPFCRSHIFGKKKGLHSHFRLLFSKGVDSLIALPKKEWQSFSAHLKEMEEGIILF